MNRLNEILEELKNKQSPLPSGACKCDKCNDIGFIETEIDGYIYSKECECQTKQRNRERQAKYIAESGLSEVLETLTFDTYKTDKSTTKAVCEKARKYLDEYQDYWWFINGISGCGKTHITTAICSELIKQGVQVHYMQWRDESVEIKAVINNSEQYNDRMRRLKRVKVLYIDDFFKGAVTEADVKLAFEILNARYNSKLPTLLSSERSINEIIEIDEAIGGRINQMAGKYNLNIKMIGNRRIENE